MKKIKLGIIAEELFKYSLITYLLLLLAETVKEGFVSYFLNLNYILGVVLISGIVMALTAPEKGEPEQPRKLSGKDLQNSFLFSIGGALLVYYKTQELGNIALIITVLTAVIIMLLSILIFTDSSED